MLSLEKLLSKDYIPKKDVQQEIFLKTYRSYDGRGIKIAIIDTGVDVSLNGLQKTLSELPKIIDCFDFTGEGDVDTSTIRKKGKAQTLTLLSGRSIKIPINWKNPSGEWHLGIKSGQDLYAKILDKNKRKYDIIQEVYVEETKPKTAWKKINEYKSYPEMISKDFNIDCIVWNDGKKWQACLITSFCKDIKDAKVLTNFRDCHENCFIFDNIACCVTIHNEGNLLELFLPKSGHGSLVAQVAAAHFPDQPEKDGLAPGAQIVLMNVLTCKIPVVDSTIKALNKCIELEVDIVNFSYMSPFFSDRAIIETLQKMTNQHGIILIKAAGNSGPFISSLEINTRNCNDSLFTVGSVFTTDLMKTINGKENIDQRPFVWYYSAKGPMPNGARGVNFVVPGDIIVESPKWNHLKKEIAYGTSFAAPNAAGAIACLLSGLKAKSIKYTPAMIKMALSNTALLPVGGDRLGFGNGIIQIKSAFEYFMQFKNNLSRIIFPQVFLNQSNEKGIVIYKTFKDENIFDYSINVIHETKKEVPWILKLASENDYIEHSKTVTDNSFDVKINTSLKPGNVFYSEIYGFDPSNLSIGPIFHLPITIIVPETTVNYSVQKEILFQPPTIFNYFVDPPRNSKKCTIKLINPKNGKNIFEKIFEESGNLSECRYFFTPSESKYPWRVDVKWEKILQVYIFQYVVTEAAKCFTLKCNLEINFE